MRRYDTVIFDLDGTILDTLGDLTDAVNATMVRYGFAQRTQEEVRAFIGNGVGKLIERCLPAGGQTPHFDDCLADFRTYYAANLMHKTIPYPGICDLLAALQAHGYRLAVVSNKFDRAVKELTSAFFAQYIFVAIGEQPGVPKKPAPDSVLQALNLLGAHKEQALYVGDSDVDILTASNAGMREIAVTWGFRSRTSLQKGGAVHLADTPEALLDIILSFG